MKRLLILAAGAAGLWLGMPNALVQLPFLVLCYPAALYLLGTETADWRQALRWGWLCGLLGSAACLYWLAIPIHDFGGLPWFLAAPSALLMGAYVGLYGGVFAAFASFLRSESHLRRSLLLGLGWYGLELFRGWFGTGFPWLSLSSAFVPWPSMIQTVSLIGEYGLSGLLVGLTCLFTGDLRAALLEGMTTRWKPLLAFAACLVLIVAFTFVDLRAGVVMLYVCGAFLDWLFRRAKMPWGRHILGALLCLFTLFVYSFLHERELADQSDQADQAVPVALIQGSLDQNVKWEPQMQRLTVQRYLSLSLEALKPASGPKPVLLIWPETSMPFDFERNPELSPRIRAFAKEHQVAILFGVPGFRRELDGTIKTFNRAHLILPDGRDGGVYEKRHLVPFGEYTPPFLDIPFLTELLQGMGDFSVGERVAPLHLPVASSAAGAGAAGTAEAGTLVPGMLICYEAIFPELAQTQVAAGATLLINISNDAWFGRSAAPEQHFQQSILRAVEQGRWLLRATNTGLSALVSPSGKSIARGSLFKPEVVSGIVYPRTARTFFSVFGSWVVWGALGLFVLAFPWQRLRKHKTT